MNKTNSFSLNYSQCLLLTTKDLQATLACGRVSAIKIGTAAEARVEVGRRVLWNRTKIEKYLEKIAV